MLLQKLRGNKERTPVIRPSRILERIYILPLSHRGRLKSSSRVARGRVGVSFQSFGGAVLLLSLLTCLSSRRANAQDVVEAGALTSGSVAASSSMKIAPVPPSKIPENQSKSPHLAVTTNQHPEVANRQALEQKAGKNPSKLLLRSTPSGAQVFINGIFVGNTPLLLMVAPGKYQMELRGARQEHAASSVDLLPNETRTVALTLSARYPTRVSVR